MKKLVLYIFIFLILTGCGIKNNDFTTKCQQRSTSEGFIYNKNIELIFSDDLIKKAIISHEYEATNKIGESSLQAAKIGLEDYIRKNKNNFGFNEMLKEDNINYYFYQYELNFDSMSDEDISKFSMTRDYLDQIKTYKEEMNCK